MIGSGISPTPNKNFFYEGPTIIDTNISTPFAVDEIEKLKSPDNKYLERPNSMNRQSYGGSGE